MIWSEFVEVARVRAVEETDRERQIWSEETLRAATLEASSGAGSGAETLLARRAGLLKGRALRSDWGARLSAPVIPGWIGMTGWVLAFLVGWWLAALGQESEINLLSLPLVGLLVWNVVVFVLSLLPGNPDKSPAWMGKLLGKFDRLPVEADRASTPAGIGLGRFQELTSKAVLRRFSCRVRAWLHVAAAVLALGSIAGMYARGWSKEYRAVWESTLLDEAAAQKFFSVLFAPASAITGRPVPLEKVPDMRRRIDDRAAQPGEALPWIHLYAATLGLVVLVPRSLLVVLELVRARGVASTVLRTGEWREYVDGLLGSVPGGGTSAQVLTHGLAHDAGSRDRWRKMAHKRWRDVGAIEFHSIPVGGEAHFIATQPDPGSRCLLVFNMASVPEAEVHRWLAEALVSGMKDGKAAGTNLLLALDDSDLRKRWGGYADLEKRLEEKFQSWRSLMEGLNVSWIV